METFLFGVYISATTFLCWYAVNLDEDNYPNKENSIKKLDEKGDK